METLGPGEMSVDRAVGGRVDARFHERVLDHVPLPVLVLDPLGHLTYVNRAVLDLTGWTEADVLGTTIVDHVHPGDIGWVATAYEQLNTVVTDERQRKSRPGLRFRILGHDGTAHPIEAYGGALGDDVIDGTVYALRPAVEDGLLDDILTGIGGGATLEEIVTDSIRLTTAPPLEVDAAVFAQHADGTAELLASSNRSLAGLVADTTTDAPWSTLASGPAHTPVDELPDEFRRDLAAAGFRDCFHAGAHAPNVELTLRIIVASRDSHRVWTGVIQRLERARELMSVVLLKRHNDLVLADAAARDSLTGLPNRAGLQHRFAAAQDRTEGSALMFVDLDGFKTINDAHGHGVGDQVLTTMADRLRRAVRIDDVVARIGGDEFAILVGEPGSRLDDTVLRRLADRVVGMSAEPVLIGDRSVGLSASVGVSRVTPGRSLDETLTRADAAMYDAKRAGGSRYRIAPNLD